MTKDVEIIIVEENLTESEHLKRILEQHGHHVSIEHNGQGALDRMRRSSADITGMSLRFSSALISRQSA